MNKSLTRLTTEYLPSEDRLRLSGEDADGEAVRIWLTQRLLRRLLPALLNWLERQAGTLPRPEIILEFAQEAARVGLQAQPPVRADGAAGWLATAIDITPGAQHVELAFRAAPDLRATLVLEATALRQWLGIMHGHWAGAGWPAAVWPTWMSESAAPARQGAAVLH